MTEGFPAKLVADRARAVSSCDHRDRRLVVSLVRDLASFPYRPMSRVRAAKTSARLARPTGGLPLDDLARGYTPAEIYTVYLHNERNRTTNRYEAIFVVALALCHTVILESSLGRSDSRWRCLIFNVSRLKSFRAHCSFVRKRLHCSRSIQLRSSVKPEGCPANFRHARYRPNPKTNGYARTKIYIQLLFLYNGSSFFKFASNNYAKYRRRFMRDTHYEYYYTLYRMEKTCFSQELSS